MKSQKMRMVVSILIVISVSVSFLLVGGAQKASEAAKKPVMAMVTNQSGLGDQAFNDATWAGFILAQEKLGIEPKVLESREQAQYVPNLSILADQRSDLVVGVGFMIKDAVKEVADLYPDTNFGLVDGIVDAPNVACLLFKENEGAFLMGAIAAKMSQSCTVGFFGGMSNPFTNRFESGYSAVVKTENPEMDVLV